MSEITFIPLKTPEGQTAGHAKVQNGVVALSLRANAGAQALILTSGGSVMSEVTGQIRASGQVQAVALHDHGKLRCCGFARGSRCTVDEIRAQLIALYAKPTQKPQPVATPEPPKTSSSSTVRPFPLRQQAETAADSAHSAKTPAPCQQEEASRNCAEAEHTPCQQPPISSSSLEPARDVLQAPTASESINVSAPRSGPAEAQQDPCVTRVETTVKVWPMEREPVPCQTCGAATDHGKDDVVGDDEEDMKAFLEQLQQETAAALFPPPEAVSPESTEDTARRAEAFAALLERCEAVFEKIAITPEQPARPEPPTREPLVFHHEEPVLEPMNRSAEVGETLVFHNEEPLPLSEKARQAASGDRETPLACHESSKAGESNSKDAKSPQDRRGSTAAYVPAWAARAESIASWNASVDALLDNCPGNGESSNPGGRRPVPNPFPHIFPDARFYDEWDDAGTHLLIGSWQRGMESFTVTAVRGEYSPRPPEHLPGFTRYIRTKQGGFWVRVDD